MKKFVFFLFYTFMALDAYADIPFSITCNDTAGNGCEITGNFENFIIEKCSGISKIDQNTPVIIDTSKTGSICSNKIKAERVTGCSTMGRYVKNYYVVFCENTPILDTIGTKYDGITDANWSYAEKKCRGSGGAFNNGECTCPNNQTKPQNGECLCDIGNTKYLVGDSCNEGTACISTGGDPKDDSRCDCPEHMSAVNLRNTGIEVCECNKGYQYRDPMRRWEGCVKINKTITISGTVQDHNSHDTLPAATISIIDGGNTVPMGGTSDTNGSFTIQNVPNTAYVKFSYTGYKSALYAATDLTKNLTIKLKSDPYTLNEITITPSDEQPTTTTNPTQDCKDTGGTDYDATNKKCICPADKFLEEYKYENKYSICRCMDGYHRDGTPDENGKYPATGECVDAGDYETHKEFDSAAWRRDTENAYKHERDNAQSWENKGITAGSTLLTGEGAMKAAQALAEQRADERAEREMAEYITTMKCEYGGGQQVNLGAEETLPFGELSTYYTEYKQLADKLKETKAALNLRPGIENEVLYEKAETGLYRYQTAETGGGGFTSVARALMNPDGADAEQWNAQKAEVAQNLQTGTLLTAGGLATGAVGNYFVNRNHKPLELKRKFKEIKTKLENDYPEIFTVPVISTPEPEPEPEPEPTPEPVVAPTEEIHLELPPVYGPGFKYGDYELENKGKQALDEAINLISQALTAQGVENTRIKIHVIGHSDRDRVKPNKRYKDNYDLSRKRATKVLDYLLDGLTNKNLDSRIDFDYSNIEGRGPDECVKGEDPQKCRRVDIEVTDITNYQQQ